VKYYPAGNSQKPDVVMSTHGRGTARLAHALSARAPNPHRASRLRPVKGLQRIVLAGAAALAAMAYVWVAAVRAVPGVRRRKAEARARRAPR